MTNINVACLIAPSDDHRIAYRRVARVPHASAVARRQMHAIDTQPSLPVTLHMNVALNIARRDLAGRKAYHIDRAKMFKSQ